LLLSYQYFRRFFSKFPLTTHCPASVVKKQRISRQFGFIDINLRLWRDPLYTVEAAGVFHNILLRCHTLFGIMAALLPGAERIEMYGKNMKIADFDADLWHALQGELQRQEDHIELIASENYASPRVLAAQGTVLTNKYAEGYPGKRYYGGCEYVDVAEQLAIDRVKSLFGADYANVQPHSGSQANAAVYLALLQPGDTILGMSLADGGHLTHGAKVNFSGKIFNAIQYGLNPETGQIDYDQIDALADQHKPKMIIGGFSAYSRIVDWKRMRAAADRVGAWFVVDMAHVAGLVAADEYPNPVPIADVVTSTTHKTLRGPRGGIIVARSNPDVEKKLNSLVFPGTQGGPLMHVIAAKAVAFKEAMQPEFKTYQRQVVRNARTMADALIKRGHKIVSGGTDNHLFLVNLIDKGLTGKDADAALGSANITVNKNAVPKDPQSPFVTSGIRIGTPAVTTRGFAEKECDELAGWIADILDNIGSQGTIEKVQKKVLELCRRFPVYEH
jgi:glycine hydroxymethyltransferase